MLGDGERALRAARRHRERQDLHAGQRHRPAPAARPGDLAQQDAGRPALQRVQVVLPGERRRVLRLLLRLLPARGLHPAVGHLHREGRARQRRDRPHAPLRHHLALRAAGRGGGGLGVVHLRHRRARDVPRDARVAARPARRWTATRSSGRWSPCSTSATTTTSAAGRSGCAATWWRCSPPTRSRRRSGSSSSATASSGS